VSATLSQIRTGLATNLRTISGLRVFEELPDNPSPPVAVFALNQISFDQNFGGLAKYDFTVQVIVGRAAERTAQRALDLYVAPSGASSVKGAIESNRSMSGVVSDTYVESVPSVGQITVNDQLYLAADFLVAVYS
jgi:hypothetical protein